METLLYNDIQEIKQQLAKIDAKLEEREWHTDNHRERLTANERDISELKRTMSALKAWITTAGLLGGIIGWVCNYLIK